MGASTEKRSKCKHKRGNMRDREREVKQGAVCVCVCRLQLAEGFPEPTASVVELLNNFTGLSERSFKVATWPGQHSRAEQQALLGLCTHTHIHSYTSIHTHTSSNKTQPASC